MKYANQTIIYLQLKIHSAVNHVRPVIVIRQVKSCLMPQVSRIHVGSTDLQCSVDGKCQCKPGVTGDKCDRCEANYWNFPEEADPGCESCDCMVEGSLGNR